MKLIALVENRTISPEYSPSHGLSLYIEALGHKILFDLGKDQSFLENAQKLGVDIAAVDTLIISHGHQDHGGGLAAFLANNDRAKIYIRKRAFLPHLIAEGGELKLAGLDPNLEDNERIIFTDSLHKIDEGLLLFSDVPRQRLLSLSNDFLYEDRGEGDYGPDRFEHEQNLIISEKGKHILLVGCAHCGIVNILEKARALVEQKLDLVIGGFHLFNPITMINEEESLIRRIAAELKEKDTLFYTCHCTGEAAFALLQEDMGEQIRYLATGMNLEL